MNVIFTVPGKPQGKARARTFYNKKLGHSQSFTPEQTVNYENRIMTCFVNGCNSIAWFNNEPLFMSIIAYYEIPKSTTKKNRELIAKGEILPTKKPDADNIAKVVCDALNGVAYQDDTQITSLRVEKRYTLTEPRLVVCIQEDTNER